MSADTATVPKREENNEPPTRNAVGWRSALAVLALAALVATFHHLFEPGIKVALQFDGRHYFETCQRVTALILSAVSGNFSAVSANEHLLREWLLLDGPVLPTIFGTALALTGRVPISADWQLLIVVQTVLQAVSSVLVALLVGRLTQRRDIAVGCGILWAVYPPAILACSRLMTETLAVVLLLSLPLFLERARFNKVAAILAGLVAALLILLKPGMIPSVVLCLIAGTFFFKSRTITSILLVAGIAVGLSPWLCYTKVVTGKASITVQRLPVHNAMISWDPETEGWQTSPASKFEQVMNSGNEPLPVVEGIWLSHPRECLKLLYCKFGNLYLSAWNDYRASVFGLSASAQQPIHLLFLCGLFFGLSAGLVQIRSVAAEQRAAFLLCSAAVAGQTIYLLFEPVCRYAFPMMAFAPVLFGSALAGLLTATKAQRRVMLLTGGLCVLGCMGVLLSSANLAQQPETSIAANPGDKITKSFTFNRPISNSFDTALLLIDCDKNLSPQDISVNGMPVDSSFLPLNYGDIGRYQSFNLLKEFAYVLNRNVDDFRQWRAVALPIESIKGKTKIELTIKQANGVASKIYLGPQSKERRILSPDFLNINRLINSTHSLETRIYDAVQTGECTQSCAINGQPIQGNPQLRIALLRLNAAEAISAPSNGKKPYRFELNAEAFDPLLRGKDGNILISRSILVAARSNSTRITLPPLQNAKNLSIKISGLARGSKQHSALGLVVSAVNTKGQETLLARLPGAFAVDTTWQKFEWQDFVPASINGSRVEALTVSVFPGQWQQIAGYGADKSSSTISIRELNVEVQSAKIPSLTEHSIYYY